MRISDWSSDVCSSDLPLGVALAQRREEGAAGNQPAGDGTAVEAELYRLVEQHLQEIGRAGIGGRAKVGDGLDLLLAVARAARDYGEAEATRGTVPHTDAGRQVVRSEERRVGQACVRQGRSKGWPD